ncbi:MAG: ABC transporter ATP-binding protein [Bacteroides sp.]|jgi:subfamily B ATP-binding cassette protein MsbA|nr:ABC transporter ATP-binding protein [Bacteroides sp.]
MKNFLKIIQYILPYKGKVALNVIFNLMSVIFSLFSITMAIPFLGILFQIQEMVYEKVPFSFSLSSLMHNFNYYISRLIENHGPFYALILIGVVVIVTSLMKNSFKYMAMYFLTPIRNGVVKDIRNAMYKKTIDLPLAYYTRERKGDIISRMTNDVHQIEISVISSLEMVFREPITILVYLSSLLVLSPQLTLFVLILLPLSGLVIGRVGKSLRATALRSQSRLGTILSVMEETITGLRVIKAFNAEEMMNRRFRGLNQKYTRLMNRLYRRHYLASPMSEFLGTLVVVIIMLFGGAMVLRGHGGLSPNAFIGYLLIFSQIINPAKSFSQAYYNIQKGMASADRIDDVLKAVNPIKEPADALSKTSFDNEITLQNVSFQYENEPVLRNINLTIRKGQMVALVGQSGAGKSTLVDLIPRFYDTSMGEILIDGFPIRNVKIEDLRALMGNVNQEPILFNDTFYNNIAFGDSEVTEEEVIQAARVANAHEFIERTPEGYQTNIGDRGSKLSGGQRQRISIARAILKNPPILILDEATSALDTESEKLVQEALHNIMQNRTSIVVAHRLSTVVNADLICVMHEGEIVEQGTHQELLDKNGIYKKLHSLQMFS